MKPEHYRKHGACSTCTYRHYSPVDKCKHCGRGARNIDRCIKHGFEIENVSTDTCDHWTEECYE